MKEKNKMDYVKDILVALFGGYTVTILGIVILAFLLLMIQISENTVDIGILVIYVLACLFTGVIVGKRTKNKLPEFQYPLCFQKFESSTTKMPV